MGTERDESKPATEVDALVVGAGLAGITAALVLREQGVRAVVSHGAPGHTATFSGIWKLGEARALRARPSALVQDHVRDIATHEPDHPFARLGASESIESLHDALAHVSPATPSEPSLVPSTEALAWYPTSHGLLCLGTGSDTLAAWPLPSRPKTIAVIDAAAWGASLHERSVLGWQYDAHQLGLPAVALTSVQLPAPSQIPSWATAHSIGLARFVDSEEGMAALAAAVQPLVPAAASELWLPAVLGLGSHRSRLRDLEQALGLPVREVAADDGVVAGHRRQMALMQTLRAQDVPCVARTQHLSMEDGVAVATLADTTRVQAKTVVMATGRFVGGGLAWKGQHRCLETLWGWPLTAMDLVAVTERSPLDLTSSVPRAPHAIEAAGVATDGWCRPLLRGAYDGRVAIAGGLQGGWFERTTPSADGVALVTGARAARAVLSACKPVGAEERS